MIAVLGGGITGLALGRELDRHAVDFTVLEASTDPGGVIRSAEVDGRVLDWGPQRARLTGRLRQTVEELGLGDEVLTAPHDLHLFVYGRGRLRAVPYSVAGFLTSDVVSWGSKLRAALEPFTGAARDDERVADLFTRKFGREMYETVIGPLYGGLYASDPAEMEVGLSLMHVLREFGVGRSLVGRLLQGGGRITPPPACTFRDGMQMLPRAMARSLGARLRLEAPVRSLERRGRGWSVGFETGERVEASHVVLTTPAFVTAELLRQVAPRSADALDRLNYNPLAVVHLDADTDLRGTGFKVAFGETDLTLTGVTFNDSLFGRRNLYTAYLGGARHPEVEEMDPDALGELAVQEFRTCTGYDARVLSVARERMPAWDVSWSALADVTLPDGLHIAGNWWSRPGLPGRLTEAARLSQRLVAEADTRSPQPERVLQPR